MVHVHTSFELVRVQASVVSRLLLSMTNQVRVFLRKVQVAGFNTKDLVKQCAHIVRIYVGQCVARDRTHLRVNIVYKV